MDPPKGVEAITEENIRGSVADLYVRSRLGWNAPCRPRVGVLAAA
jgi:hypothetical protein